MAKAPRSLAGRVVAITGGARGIGRATAAALLAQGMPGRDRRHRATQLAQRPPPSSARARSALPLDVTDRASPSPAFLDEVERQLGPLDVLINNAGIMPIGRFVDEDDATAAAA